MNGLAIDAITEAEVIAHVLGALQAGRGGRLVTLNVDIFRAASRDPALRRLISASTLRVADGMPVVWATRLRGTPVPERVTGASLILSLSQAAAQAGRSVYLLGGAPGVPEQARAALCRRYPGLTVAGVEAPAFGFDSTPVGIRAVCARLVAAAPDIVYVGLGFPKQERVIAHVAPSLPSAWFVGCGAAIPFAAGALQRAPRWMQEAGLEWLFRMAREPRRLAQRYLIDDLPFAGLLLTSCFARRLGWPGGG
jgi:N-acetylglucosaminyldiphosphoundecaprenol N-acetyl-beta-D-mannosaminyltransferase